MSFIINQNFDLKSPQFNFARDYFDNLAELKAADENNFPDHFITNVAGNLYQLNKSYTPSDTTGKWRKIKLGSDVDLSGYATTAELNKKAAKSEAVKTLSTTADRSKISIAGTHVDNTTTVADIPLAAYSDISDEENTQKAGLVTGAERKRLLALGLSGTSFNNVANNTKGLRLNLNGTNSSVDISIAKPGDDSTYGLMSGADKAKLDDVANTYATKSEVSALSSALVYKGTIGTKGTITSTNVAAKVGDVYVAIDGAPAVNGVALEAGDMIIAKTAGDGSTTTPTWTAVQTNINGAVTSTGLLTGNTLILGGSNRTIKSSSGNGFVKVVNGGVLYDDNVVAAGGALGAGKLIISKDDKKIQPAIGTGFVKISNGVVIADNKTYLTSVPKATTTAVGGGKVVNVFNKTAATINTDPEASNVTLYGLQIDKDGNFYTPVKNAAAYSLPTASDNILGGIKAVKTNKTLGATQLQDNITDIADRYYPVLMVNSDRACVNIPWENPKSYIDLEFDDTSNKAISNSTVTTTINNLKNDIKRLYAAVDGVGSIPELEITKLFD